MDLQQQQHNSTNSHYFIFLEPKPPYPTVWSPDICKIAATWSRYRCKFELDPTKITPATFLKISLWNNPAIKDKFTGIPLHYPRYMNIYRTCGDIVSVTGECIIPNNTIEEHMLTKVVRELYQLVPQVHNDDHKLEEAFVNENRCFKSLTTRELSALVLKYTSTDERRWQEKWRTLIGVEFPNIKPNLKNIYCYPSPYVECDISLRLLYHALPHQTKLETY